MRKRRLQIMENSQNRGKDVSLVITSTLSDNYTVLLMLITATGLLFRFSGIGGSPLTSEEIAGASLARLSISQIWASIDRGSVFNPPLYFWVQHFLLIPGKTEFFIRFLSALCGTLSIPVTYLLGQEFHSRDVGILAAAILAVSPYHISCSQYGAPYSMMLLITLISIIFFVQLIRTSNSAAGAYFGLFSGLSFWVTYYSIILTFSLVLFEFVERRRHSFQASGETRALNVGAIFFLVIITPLSSLIRDQAKIQGIMSLHRNPLGAGAALESLNQVFTLNEPLMIMTIILLIIGIVGLFRYDSQLFSLLLFMMVVPASLVIFMSYWITFETQCILLVLPAVCIGAACSYTVFYLFLSRWIKVSRLLVLVLFLLLFGAMSFHN
jgi:mannosyltransferase